ncbi:NADH-quinone oxidoreductase subunit B family protein [Phytoactinopolyspora halotolerans]|uniref:Oxidoreductase n=1 Tax=Phytoactinopolyspora halotolerans TaxID=1981512 RepID=A0A6L9S7B9_9ACTN|nr:oxidoreductase [Phytoactinopolyspora halotolerans]NEE00641.1 oxidoreductase [Phytoactinopolyspora halotolerans]
MTDTSARRLPTLAVWKFTSCDGCQLTLLDCEDELLPLAGQVRIAHFLEASRESLPGPYDVSLVEGSVSTPDEIDRLKRIREVSGVLVAIGACATAGGIQALRNFADVDEFRSVVYARPEYVQTLDRSTPASAHVRVDFELRGCPIDKRQLLEVLTAYLVGRKPNIPRHSVCFECKARGTTCVMVAHGTPCLGPVTQAGCGAICPAYSRGCFGCFGPVAVDGAPAANVTGLVERLRALRMADDDIVRALRTFNSAAPEFSDAVPDGPSGRTR